MKVVFLSLWYSENMGYIENCLPAAMAQLGHEVYVVTSTAQVYYNAKDCNGVYDKYHGSRLSPIGETIIDGVRVIRLPFYTFYGKFILKGLGSVLKRIRPDVVHSLDAFSFITLQGAFYKIRYGYKLFTVNHIVASVFPLYQEKKNSVLAHIGFALSRTIPGWFVAKLTSRCFPATIDALEIANRHFGIPRRKLKLTPLGVDTNLFNTSVLANRSELRNAFGITADHILCIYTGRFTDGKNPLILAKAIGKLVVLGKPFRAIFVGNGPQQDAIAQEQGCFVHEFIPYRQLPPFYKMADIGVWPRQESTSMLDAVASGLPIVVSDRVMATERVEGNGLTYVENDVDSLVEALLKLESIDLREKLSEYGSNKIRTKYSWLAIADARIQDYNEFVR